MMPETILTNARIVMPDAVVGGTLVMRDGIIAAIDSRPSTVAGARDCGGDLLMPGVVEIHTDNLEVAFSPRPTVSWPGRAAMVIHDAQIASAGITTVCDAVCVGFYGNDPKRQNLLKTSIHAVHAGIAEGWLRAEHWLHLRCEVSDPHVLEIFDPLAADERVRVVSLMDHTPGQRQWRNIEHYLAFNRGRTQLSDAELIERIAIRREEQARFARPNRTGIIERISGRAITLASHDDTTLKHIEEARQDHITVSEFPTTLEAAKGARDAGLATVMGGPNVVLGGSHSGNISAKTLAAHDLLDVLSSDYVPHSLVHAGFVLHRELGLGLPKIAAMLSATPADLLGFSDRGRLELGLRADVIRVTETSDVPVIRAVWREGVHVA